MQQRKKSFQFFFQFSLLSLISGFVTHFQLRLVSSRLAGGTQFQLEKRSPSHLTKVAPKNQCACIEMTISVPISVKLTKPKQTKSSPTARAAERGSI